MANSKSKNLILSIHIDSQEINLAAGYVDNETVNLLALKRGDLQGINFGNITNKDLFTSSVVANLQDFLDNHLRIYSNETAKSLNLEVTNGKLVVKKISYNIIVSELRKQATIQTHILKQILQEHFFAEDVVLSDEKIFKCTADTATTTLLVEDSPEDKPYLINLNLCYNSAWINFITDQNDYTVSSLSVEKGFKEIVNGVNNSPRVRSPLPLETIYNGLRGYRFLATRSKVDLRFPLFNINFSLSEIEQAIILPLQEVFHLCYDKFRELDRNNLRFTDNFLSKVKINFMGYGADLYDISSVVSLIFSERLTDELESLKRQETKLSSSEETSLNLVTGMLNHSNSYLPSMNVKTKQLIYSSSNDQLKFAHTTLRIGNKAKMIDGVCFSFSNQMVDRSGRVSYKQHLQYLDQFTTSLGLIYNFHLAQPKPIKLGFFVSLLKFFKM